MLSLSISLIMSQSNNCPLSYAYIYIGAIAVKAGVFGRSSTYYRANDFSCVGSERYLTDCSHSFLTELNNNYYDYGFSAGVICQGNTSAPTQCEHGDVRLVNGQKKTEGRVEVCAYGYWATVSHDDWGTVETDIVCKQLNFATDGKEGDVTSH